MKGLIFAGIVGPLVLAVLGVWYVYVLPRTFRNQEPLSMVHIGAVTSQSVDLVFVGPSPVAFVEYMEVSVMAQGAEDVFSRARWRDGTRHTVDGLLPDLEYVVTVEGGERKFSMRVRTLQTEGEPLKRGFSFVFGSCLQRRSWPFHRTLLLDFIAEKRPLFAFFLGDSIYTDAMYGLHNVSAELAYKQLLRDPSFTEFVAQVPSLFSFDDHEIHDNADDVGSEFFQRNIKGSLPWKNLIGIWAFVSVPCVVALVTIGNVAFMMLDTRSHRSRNAAPDGPDKTLLGADQFQWALAWARNTQSARVRFILSPVPFSVSVRRGDGWALFGREREALLEVLAAHANTTTIFLSGDVHFAYSMRIRRNVFEVSASPISSFPLPSKLSLEAPEEVLFESQWKQHIGFVEVSSEVEDQVNVSLYGEIPGITTWLLDKRRINIS